LRTAPGVAVFVYDTGIEQLLSAGIWSGLSAGADDPDLRVVDVDAVRQPPTLPGDVGDRRVLAEVRRPERIAPTAADGQAVDRRPVEPDLGIAGAAHVAVLVMTPG